VKKKIEKLMAAVMLISLIALVVVGGTTNAEKNGNRMFSTNESFINALETKVDLSNPKDVFRYVFANLQDEVIVYPTENHYYFEFSAQGKVVKGNIEISAEWRDKGGIIIAYDEVNTFSQAPNNLSGAAILSTQDGIEVRKIAPFQYKIIFQGRTVTFNLNQIEQTLPHRIRLTPEEVFVGRIFDESGLKFFLVFNQKFHHLFWLLDDDEKMSETLTPIDDEILIGNRSAFAFYDDKPNARKILIGVSKNEVKKNSWYDGPFDQLPDNYIATGQVEVRKYMEAAYFYAKGKINKFGIFLDDQESRVAITSYSFYSHPDELRQLVGEANKVRNRDKSKFYCSITGHLP
jgi:hypothetical protein